VGDDGRQGFAPFRSFHRQEWQRVAVALADLEDLTAPTPFAAANLGVAPVAGWAGAMASCRSRETATESPSPTPRPGATLSRGATVSAAHGCRIASAPTPSAASTAITETIANPGSPFPTAAEREAIRSR
jgi:hypothetical protein